MSTAKRFSHRPRLLPGAAVAPLFAVLLAACQSASAQPQGPSELRSPARVSVDFGAREGELLRTERLNTFDNGRITADAERRDDDVAFLNEQGLHADIVRIGPSESLCNVTTNTCDFTPVADWLNDVSDASDSVVVHLTPRSIIQAKLPPAQAKPLLKMLIKGLKERFPRIEYIEAFNEPDWGFHGAQVRAGQTPVIQPEELYPYYVPFYEAVNEVNKELRPHVPLKVGGPTLMSFDHPGWMEAFLDGYAADPNPKKRLDFISRASAKSTDVRFR